MWKKRKVRSEPRSHDLCNAVRNMRLTWDFAGLSALTLKWISLIAFSIKLTL